MLPLKRLGKPGLGILQSLQYFTLWISCMTMMLPMKKVIALNMIVPYTVRLYRISLKNFIRHTYIQFVLLKNESENMSDFYLKNCVSIMSNL